MKYLPMIYGNPERLLADEWPESIGKAQGLRREAPGVRRVARGLPLGRRAQGEADCRSPEVPYRETKEYLATGSVALTHGC